MLRVMKDYTLIGLGLVLGIPFSIAANLLTPRYQRWRASRSEKAAEKFQLKDADARFVIGWLAQNPGRAQMYLLLNVTMIMVRLMNLGLTIGLMVFAVLRLDSVVGWKSVVGNVFIAVTAIAGIFFAMEFIRFTTRVMNTFASVIKTNRWPVSFGLARIEHEDEVDQDLK